MTSTNSEYLLQELSADLYAHLKSSNDHDALIRVGQGLRLRNFKVHSVILRARSLYFRNMFSRNNKSVANSSSNINKKIESEENNFEFIIEKPNGNVKVFEIIIK